MNAQKKTWKVRNAYGFYFCQFCPLFLTRNLYLAKAAKFINPISWESKWTDNKEPSLEFAVYLQSMPNSVNIRPFLQPKSDQR